MTNRAEKDVRESPVKGDVIEHLRKTFDNGEGVKKGLSRQVFATRAGISTSTLQRAEASEPGTELPTLTGIAQVLGVPLSAIYDNDVLANMDVALGGEPPAWFATWAEQADARLRDIETRQNEILRLLERGR